MKNILIYLSLVLVLSSCIDLDIDNVEGRGPVVKETLYLSPFDEISSQIGADINIYYSDVYEVDIFMQENLFDYLETAVINNRLHFSFGNTTVSTTEGIIIDIYTPEAWKFQLTGAGNIFSEIPLEEITVTGAANIKCIGPGDKVTITVSGTANMDLFSMPVNEADIRISGNADIMVTALDRLKVNISGVGNIYYKGHPYITQQISGVGRVVDSN